MSDPNELYDVTIIGAAPVLPLIWLLSLPLTLLLWWRNPLVERGGTGGGLHRAAKFIHDYCAVRPSINSPIEV